MKMSLSLSSSVVILTPIFLGLLMMMAVKSSAASMNSHDYKDALMKSILFFEGQRSGKLPPNQRMKWRKDSALRDGYDVGTTRSYPPIDLVGGYYDAGDNVKFNFPMAFSTTILAWSVLESGKFMGSDLQHALDAIRWATDYFLKATIKRDIVYVQVGDPYGDHNCWERPEDMDTPRTVFAVTKQNPGSEVSAEIAAALAASSMVFRTRDRVYAARLLNRAKRVFQFADKYRGSYNDSLGQWVCPFYCDFSGYEDELMWGAAWLFRATKKLYYWNYILNNVQNMEKSGGSFAEFGWDSKHAGVNVLVSILVKNNTAFANRFLANADKFVCSVLPESPSVSVSYSPGGLIFKSGGSNLQHATALSFLLLNYARYMKLARRVVHCGNVVASPARLIQVAKGQVDYILGSNPMKMSYMVGYGKKYPQRVHHRGSSLLSIDQRPQRIDCNTGASYFFLDKPNPNLLIGAVVGGPDVNDAYVDSRADFVHSEPTTYINAPFVGLLAYFKSNPSS